MKTEFLKYIPAAAVIALTTTAALAQIGPGARGPSARSPARTPPTATERADRAGAFCAEIRARDAARFAYLEQRLNLTAAQKPLFDKWKAAQDSIAAERLANCGKAGPAAAPDPNRRPTPPERNARREEMLKQQLAALQKTSGPEAALYNALTPEQKPLLDRGGMGLGMRGGARFMGRGGMMHARFMGPGPARGADMQGPDMGGRGMRGPRGRGGPDAPPPPAPPR